MRLDKLGRPMATLRGADAAAVVGAAVTRINVGGSADTFIVEV